MILILTGPLDHHADYVGQKLRERGVDFIRFNPAQFPSQAEVSLLYSSKGHIRHILRMGVEHIDMHRLEAVWCRRPTPPVAHKEIIDKCSRDLVEIECYTLVNDVWNSLDCLWVPGRHVVIQRAEFKASQLKVAGELGFELPPTLFTNSPADFLEFYRQHSGHIVSKSAGYSSYTAVGRSFCRYTEVVSKRDVGYAHAVATAHLSFRPMSLSALNYASRLSARRSLRPRSTRKRVIILVTTGGATTAIRHRTFHMNCRVMWRSAACSSWNDSVSVMEPSIWCSHRMITMSSSKLIPMVSTFGLNTPPDYPSATQYAIC